jgi:hypothetical protein
VRLEGVGCDACGFTSADESGIIARLLHRGSGLSETRPDRPDRTNEKDVLSITVDKSLYRIRLNATGYHIAWAR